MFGKAGRKQQKEKQREGNSTEGEGEFSKKNDKVVNNGHGKALSSDRAVPGNHSSDNLNKSRLLCEALFMVAILGVDV